MQPARVALELQVERVQLSVEVLDDRQRDLDLLVRNRREREAAELLPGVVAFEPSEPAGLRRDAVMKQHRVDPLQPFGALVDQRLAQADAGAQVEDVRRRDPRFGQAALDQQLPHEARVEAIGLRAALGPALGARLGRLGQVHLGADALELLDDEPPARHRLHRRDQLGAVKPG